MVRCWRPVAAGHVALLAVLLWLPVSGAYHYTNQQGPLEDIWVSEDLACQVKADMPVSGTAQFFPGADEEGDCATLVVVDDELFAPDFSAHAAGTATGNLGTYTPFEPVTQTVQGLGTPDDPLVIYTEVDLPGTGLRLHQVDTYIVGESRYKTDLALTNLNKAGLGSTKEAIVYRAADCMFLGDDSGYGAVIAGVVAACQGEHRPPTALFGLSYIATVPGSHAMEGHYGDVWAAIGAHAPLPDGTCECDTWTDNGLGLSWSVTAPPQMSVIAGGHYSHWLE